MDVNNLESNNLKSNNLKSNNLESNNLESNNLEINNLDNRNFDNKILNHNNSDLNNLDNKILNHNNSDLNNLDNKNLNHYNSDLKNANKINKSDKVNGARYNKLKLVYKKAIQEILNNNFDNFEDTPQTDSFYNASTSKLLTGNIKEKFDNLKNKLSELLKKKIKEYNLENKLDNLDTLIKDNLISTRDIHEDEYIKEILESYLMEDKNKLVEFITNKIKENEEINENLEIKIKSIEEEYRNLQNEYLEKEIRIQNMIKEMKNGFL